MLEKRKVNEEKDSESKYDNVNRENTAKEYWHFKFKLAISKCDQVKDITKEGYQFLQEICYQCPIAEIKFSVQFKLAEIDYEKSKEKNIERFAQMAIQKHVGAIAKLAVHYSEKSSFFTPKYGRAMLMYFLSALNPEANIEKIKGEIEKLMAKNGDLSAAAKFYLAHLNNDSLQKVRACEGNAVKAVLVFLPKEKKIFDSLKSLINDAESSRDEELEWCIKNVQNEVLREQSQQAKYELLKSGKLTTNEYYQLGKAARDGTNEPINHVRAAIFFAYAASYGNEEAWVARDNLFTSSPRKDVRLISAPNYFVIKILDDDAFIYREGLSRYLVGDTVEAIRALRAVNKVYPEFWPMANLLLAQCYLELRRQEQIKAQQGEHKQDPKLVCSDEIINAYYAALLSVQSPGDIWIVDVCVQELPLSRENQQLTIFDKEKLAIARSNAYQNEFTQTSMGYFVDAGEFGHLESQLRAMEYQAKSNRWKLSFSYEKIIAAALKQQRYDIAIKAVTRLCVDGNWWGEADKALQVNLVFAALLGKSADSEQKYSTAVDEVKSVEDKLAKIDVKCAYSLFDLAQTQLITLNPDATEQKVVDSRRAISMLCATVADRILKLEIEQFAAERLPDNVTQLYCVLKASTPKIKYTYIDAVHHYALDKWTECKWDKLKQIVPLFAMIAWFDDDGLNALISVVGKIKNSFLKSAKKDDKAVMARSAVDLYAGIFYQEIAKQTDYNHEHIVKILEYYFASPFKGMHDQEDIDVLPCYGAHSIQSLLDCYVESLKREVETKPALNAILDKLHKWRGDLGYLTDEQDYVLDETEFKPSASSTSATESNATKIDLEFLIAQSAPRVSVVNKDDVEEKELQVIVRDSKKKESTPPPNNLKSSQTDNKLTFFWTESKSEPGLDNASEGTELQPVKVDNADTVVPRPSGAS